jgi:hypothetical protein
MGLCSIPIACMYMNGYLVVSSMFTTVLRRSSGYDVHLVFPEDVGFSVFDSFQDRTQRVLIDQLLEYLFCMNISVWTFHQATSTHIVLSGQENEAPNAPRVHHRVHRCGGPPEVRSGLLIMTSLLSCDTVRSAGLALHSESDYISKDTCGWT